jgi:hypothetical protein
VHDVFISYRWVDPDQTWVREQLAPALRQAGLTVLLDVDDFIPGRDLILEMTRAGQESRRVLCVLSPDYFEGNRMVGFEGSMARRSDPSGSEARLIPLVLRPTNLPEWIRGLVPIDWTNARDHAREWRKLLRALGAPQEGPIPSPAGPAERIAEPPAGSRSKYYLYLSGTKVDMLYAQLGRETVAGENSAGKLDAVLKDLGRAGRIGTIEEPREYFAGAFPMRWGPFLFPAVPQLTPSPLVYFGGATESTVVGLGGSAGHVLGDAGPAKTGLHSSLPYFILQLRKELGELLPGDLADSEQTLMAVYVATIHGKGPVQELEFVAKRLARGTLPAKFSSPDRPETRTILVGTPLYVALHE